MESRLMEFIIPRHPRYQCIYKNTFNIGMLIVSQKTKKIEYEIRNKNHTKALIKLKNTVMKTRLYK